MQFTLRCGIRQQLSKSSYMSNYWPFNLEAGGVTQHKKIQAESTRSFPWELHIQQESKITPREAEKTLHSGGSGHGMQLFPQFLCFFLFHPWNIHMQTMEWLQKREEEKVNPLCLLTSWYLSSYKPPQPLLIWLNLAQWYSSFTRTGPCQKFILIWRLEISVNPTIQCQSKAQDRGFYRNGCREGK